MRQRTTALRSNVVANILLTLCALTLTVLVVRRELVGNQPRRASLKSVDVADATRFARSGNRIGDPRAPIVIVVFSDYQCPFCRTFDRSVNRLVDENPGRVAVVFRHFPLESVHPYAYQAALRAECAKEQGRFPQMHELLFALHDSLGRVSESELAHRSGLPNLERFADCVNTRHYAPRIASDVRAAGELHVRVTPTAIVDGQLVEGAIEFQELQRLALGETEH